VIAVRTAYVEGEGSGGTGDHGHFLITCYARGETNVCETSGWLRES
jgi:hypothetical protein